MFFKIFLLSLATACVFAAPSVDVVPTVIPIVSQSDEVEANGTYHFSYETGNGIKREEIAYEKVIPRGRSGDSNEGGESNESDEIHVQQGSYSYTAPDGTVYTVRYIADENGFQPIGDHLPRVPGVSQTFNSAEKSGRALKSQDSAESASSPKLIASKAAPEPPTQSLPEEVEAKAAPEAPTQTLPEEIQAKAAPEAPIESLPKEAAADAAPEPPSQPTEQAAPAADSQPEVTPTQVVQTGEPILNDDTEGKSAPITEASVPSTEANSVDSQNSQPEVTTLVSTEGEQSTPNAEPISTESVSATPSESGSQEADSGTTEVPEKETELPVSTAAPEQLSTEGSGDEASSTNAVNEQASTVATDSDQSSTAASNSDDESTSSNVANSQDVATENAQQSTTESEILSTQGPELYTEDISSTTLSA